VPPIPKRSEQRRRRNSEEPDRLTLRAAQAKPLPLRRGIHPLARRWYKALTDSGQSHFYEPSDWAVALLLAEAIHDFVDDPKAAKLNAILHGSSSLMATEGDRRRMRLELTREANADDTEEVAVVTALADYQDRLGT